MAKLHAGRNAEDQETASYRMILGNCEEPDLPAHGGVARRV
jgi:hypothetical protein